MLIHPDLSFTGLCHDWGALFRDLVSNDRKVADDARDRMFGEILPKLQFEEAATLDADVGQILEQSGVDGAVRFQASALIATLCVLRPDASDSLQRAVPVLVGQLHDSDVRMRYNAAFALSNFKPEIPTTARSVLIAALNDADRRVAQGAVHGVARLAASSAEAASALGGLLATGRDRDTRLAALKSIGTVRLRDKEVILRLGDVLAEPDRDLVKEALVVLRSPGPESARQLKSQLLSLSRNRDDKELAESAAASLSTAELKE